MNFIALICARGGSKGVPGKNIRHLSGKPLITWTIEQGQAVKRIERIIVSTDSEEIAEVAREAGAEVPFMRPTELAQDNSPEWLVWRHTLNHIKQTEGYYPDGLITTPVTAPLRIVADLENCLDEYEKGDADVVITVTDSHRNPYFNMVKQREDKTMGLVIPSDDVLFRRQDAPPVYDMTTVAFVAKPEFIINKDHIFDGNVRHVHIPVERALDIDTPLDFKIAEYLINQRKEE